MSIKGRIIGAALMMALVWVVWSTAAADPGTTVESPPPDLGVGEQELAEEARFRSSQSARGRVDQRSEYNPLADRGVSWSTGYIPPQGTVSIVNQLLIGQRVALSLSDRSQIFGSAWLPLGTQSTYSLGGQQVVRQGDAWQLTLGLQGRFRRTNLIPGTANGGLGLHAVFDVIATDNTSWSAGASANIPVYRFVEDVDLSGCETRREWAEGRCGQMQAQQRWMPPSGYWLAFHAGVSHFVTDWLILDAEVFSGASQGNFYGFEAQLDPELSYGQERDLVEQTQLQAGLGPFGILNLALGTTWRLGPLAAQVALYFSNYADAPQILPYFSVGASLGGN